MALWIMPRTDYRMIEKASLAKCETSRDEHGNALLDSFANTASKAKSRERTSLFQKKYEELPEVFTYEQIARGYNTENAVRSVISRLKAAGLIEKVEKNKWKKCIATLNNVTVIKRE